MTNHQTVSSNNKRPRILIVEDEGLIAHHMNQVLSNRGYEITGMVVSGEQALRHIAKQRPDLVLMDIYLAGEMNGIQAAARIKEGWDVPIVYLTAHPEDKLLQQAKITAPYGYLSKPVQDRDLSAAIETALYRRQMEARLQESEARYRLVSELVSDFAYAFLVEADGILINEWTTEAFTRVTGYTPDELDTQEKWLHLIHPDDRAQFLEDLPLVLSGQSKEGYVHIRTKQGETRCLHLYNRPIIDEEQDRVVRIVGAAQDITERKQAEEAMDCYATELEERNKELAAFTHTVAHELKNPLGYLVGFAELMLDEDYELTEEEQKQILQKITWTGYKMSHTIANLLLLANVGQQDIQTKPLDMYQIIQEALKLLSAQIKARQADVILTPATTWPTVLGRAAWIEGVWVNYISNALKYGGDPDAGIPPRIEIGFDDQFPSREGPGEGSDKDKHIRFWVRDNGPGLTEEQRACLFTAFARLNPSRVEGHGLGLSIVQRIVHKLGGKVGVESQLGQGSLFYFTLKRIGESANG